MALTLLVMKYAALFIGVYVQVFLLLTYLGWGKKRDVLRALPPDTELPQVAIIVPCYNEEKTVIGTIESLLGLDYPKEKLSILAIDDGSRDGTWNKLQVYAHHDQVRIFHKENGGKYTVLNYGLTQTHAEIVGCLDADSRVHPAALRASVRRFISDASVMAVVPAMTIEEPKSFFQYLQKVEYETAIYVREVFHSLQALYIAPGPFSLFRKSVFDTIGTYHEAYHTEDLEIALRMQSKGMKLVFAADAFVYTRGPKTFSALVKQRVRWFYGFLQNMRYDYRSMFFSSARGHLGMFVLPLSIAAVLISLFLAPFMIYGIVPPIQNFFSRVATVGLPTLQAPSFDWFFVNTQAHIILMLITLGLTIMTVILGRRILGIRKYVSFDMLTFVVYPFVSLVWTIRAVWNTIRSHKESWR